MQLPLASNKPFLTVVIGDSLSMPRYFAGIQIEDTYAHKLDMWWREHYPKSINLSLCSPGKPLKQFMSDFNTNIIERIGNNRKIDTCIVHLGIVDCAPRPLPYLWEGLLGLAHPVIRKPIVKFLHNNRAKILRSGFSFRFTPPDKFTHLFNNFLMTLANQCKQIYIVNVAPGLKSVYERSPGLEDSIVQYNNIISQTASQFSNATLINVFDQCLSDNESYLTGDLHINQNTHNWIYEQIKNKEQLNLPGSSGE